MGFRAGEDDQVYTFSFEYDDYAEPLYLYDKDTEVYTRITADNSYLFMTTDNDDHARFSLTRHMPGVATGAEELSAGSNQPSAARKLIINDHLYILRSGQLYDVTGKTVK